MAKLAGITLTHVRAGECEMHIAVPIVIPNVNIGDTDSKATDIYQQYGGDAIKELQRIRSEEVDDEDQPAVTS